MSNSEFFPANTTSHVQPLDGAIMEVSLSVSEQTFNSGITRYSEKARPNMYQAIYWEAWDEVTAQSVQTL
jgi:hypothetical protein